LDYTLEQRAIIRRIGEVSTQINETVAAHKTAQINTARDMLDAVTALTAAIDRSNELLPLFLRHGDLWREFLDTL
jgi:hypothetical protein